MGYQQGGSRRGFVGGVATTFGDLALGSPLDLLAEERATPLEPPSRTAEDEYDLLAKLHYNENPYGPPESVMKAMNKAYKYANRYGYPDGGIVEEIATHHGVKPEHVVLGAGSSEILDVVGSAFASNG